MHAAFPVTTAHGPLFSLSLHTAALLSPCQARTVVFLTQDPKCWDYRWQLSRLALLKDPRDICFS